MEKSSLIIPRTTGITYGQEDSPSPISYIRTFSTGYEARGKQEGLPSIKAVDFQMLSSGKRGCRQKAISGDWTMRFRPPAFTGMAVGEGDISDDRGLLNGWPAGWLHSIQFSPKESTTSSILVSH
ncbi:hypothetical protein FOPG_19112 [Fusarium oxysporum f. sp. conglutinans race 2 54008]|uniref:Uncharacterized protein n=1 Tax=Fusarium oxysporum f. sp. conglutinans race 2 54008 TaxID=1089457 RepID=X0GMW7_FUSOX|nr:hypothetical protein FOPG_19112 [Fusarium oxysporum f. sp. conglutinans race 2 54008]